MLGDDLIDQLCAHALAETPNEACGFIYSSER
jgi:hypothetical protein